MTDDVYGAVEASSSYAPLPKQLGTFPLWRTSEPLLEPPGRLHVGDSRPATEASLPLIINHERDAANAREDGGMGAWGHRGLCLRRTSKQAAVAKMRFALLEPLYEAASVAGIERFEAEESRPNVDE